MIYTLTLNPAVDYHLLEIKDGKVHQSYTTPGGKGINVSQILSHLGISSVVMGFFGGFTGDYIIHELKAFEKIKTDIVKIEQDSRINVKFHGEEEVAYNHIGPIVTDENVHELLHKVQGLGSNDLLVMSGRGLPHQDDLYEKIVQICSKKHISFVLDLEGQKIKALTSYKPLLVKPNLEELEDAFNQEIKTTSQVIEYGQKLQRLGAKYVLISLGKEGSILITEKNIYQALPIDIDLISSVGAGDAMVAGFISAYRKGLDLVTCFKLAVACSVATAASKDMATYDHVSKILNKVIIKEIRDAYI